ncbi:BREX-3 system phosphatase PglZ [Mesorhizobium sp. L103C131B0]|uniref:BREX-3 system phosphatase PglZ n=1 Tax=Mesorhizobium sp. L103C131B0 TaxID=1287089 RepID=UPI0003D047CC|nr:BREX-3 system phosphatase PglZ [Mesorhizobium sp. L103C131B0]ESZ65715.1 alkaline phosphatase [Mesorhizobium sp. L103C131B0]
MRTSSLNGTWREPILAQFSLDIASVARLTVVADPDELLTEQGIVDGIRQRGFEIVPFEDHVAFRYAYERRFREVWDNGNDTNLVVVLRAARSEVSSLPFDLLQHAERDRRLLSFSLAELFPSLAPHVLSELDRGELDAVSAAQQLFKPEPMGENATRDFLMRNVFRLDPVQIQSDTDLLRALLQRHYSGKIVPKSLDERLIHLLRSTGRWEDWPLEQILPSRASFLEFLQERWPFFLQDRLVSPDGGLREKPEPYDLQFTGPKHLAFDHDDVRVYVDNLFTDGLLTPTNRLSRSLVEGTWMAVGVAGSQSADDTSRFRRLMELLHSNGPSPSSDHHEWAQVAARWAEIVALRWCLPGDVASEDKDRFNSAHKLIEQSFYAWMDTHYASLHSLSYLPRPVMVHQIPKYMAHRFSSKGVAAKLALVVVDGLAMDQWAVVRQEMPRRKWITEEFAAFAWVPTLTSVSRQSIFAGDPPFFFGQSLDTTRKEEQHWFRFWEDQGLRRGDAVYACQGTLEDDDNFTARICGKLDEPRCRIAGIVVGTIDQMLHGIVTGTDGMHAGVRHWAKRGSLWRLLDALVDRGFEVVVTADHGNVESVGMGKPNVGATADERGERVHVFSNALLRSNVSANYPGSVEWPNIGLPDDYLALIAPPLRAFIGEGKRTVAHGGICIEEVIVPFITVARSP